MRYDERDADELEGLTQELEARYATAQGANLALDLTRGKPGADQVALSDALDGALAGDFLASDGVDVRNYGGLRGIPEARALGAELLGISPEQVMAAGNSSLSMMHLAFDTAMNDGLNGPPWRELGAVKAICPVPGYDRHFTLTESFGVEMIPVPMDAAGPVMDEVEALVDAEPLAKCMWCVPKHSNPSGCTYSDATVRRIAALGQRSPGFVTLWDNAYAAHDFHFPGAELDDVLAHAVEAGVADSVVLFASTSKISFAGAGIAFVGGSANTLAALEARLAVMTVGPDKVNQLRHARFLNGRLDEHMRAHAALVRPKFEAIERVLAAALGGLGIARWTQPSGGYFVTVNTLPGLAKAVVALAGDAGVRLTPAGATHPYGQDPNDDTIRLAPTFAALDEVETATRTLALCIQLASARRLRAAAQAAQAAQ